MAEAFVAFVLTLFFQIRIGDYIQFLHKTDSEYDAVTTLATQVLNETNKTRKMKLFNELDAMDEKLDVDLTQGWEDLQ